MKEVLIHQVLSENDKTNIIVESLEGIKEEADALLSKINELLS